MEYKLTIGIRKGLETILLSSIALLTMLNMADVDLWSLAEQYLQPYLSGITVVGLLTMLSNYIKIKNKIHADEKIRTESGS